MDYTPISMNMSIAGASCFPISIISDDVSEDEEIFTVMIEGLSEALIIDTSTVMVIIEGTLIHIRLVGYVHINF